MTVLVDLLAHYGAMLWVVPVAAGVVVTGLTMDWVDRRPS